MSQDVGFDWFDQDEDDLVNNLKEKLKLVPSDPSIVEFIPKPAPVSKVQQYFNVKSSLSTQQAIATFKLCEVSKMKPLDAFLFVFTAKSDFFNSQIELNDSMKRFVVYVQVLLLIIPLELPGFHSFMLNSIARNESLLQYCSSISEKLFSAKYKSVWSDTSEVDELLLSIEALLRSIQVASITEQYLKVISEISTFIKNSNAHAIRKRLTCIRFEKTIDTILSKRRDVEDTRNLEEIFPSLEELVSTNKEALQDIAEISKSAIITKSYKNDSEYINVQKTLLREDFMISLRYYIKSLMTNHEPCSQDPVFLKDVQIILSTQCLKSPTQMVFADVLGGWTSMMNENNTENGRKSRIRRLNNLKLGALLCFTTSFDFENLILATVANKRNTSKGFIAIDVVQQYNIEPIYNTKFLMFESPAFFEPYHNFYNLIKTYAAGGAESIPMQKYIVGGENVSAAPAYLEQNCSHPYNETDRYGDLKELTKNLNLNKIQRSAFKSALCEEFCLIQGPPATGKTNLSVKIIKTLIEKTDSPIVLLTYTIESMDNILFKLSKYTDSIVRLETHHDIHKFKLKNDEEEEHKVNPLIKRLYYITKMLYKEEFEALQKLYENFDGTDDNYKTIVNTEKKLEDTRLKRKTINMLFNYELIKSKKVIAMTTTCAANTNYLLKLLESPIVIFEEAGEILESHVIACLTHFTQHVIMIGDMQLQPFTSCYQPSRIREVNVSLFERLIKRGMANTMLMKQCRMRPEIAKLICPIIYDKMKNAKSVREYPQVKGMLKNLFFLSHKKMEYNDKVSSSKYNTYECEKLFELTKHLITEGEYDPHKIVVLSPYAKQIHSILEKFRKDPNLSNVQVATVESFQGLEKNIVLLSLVHSNESKDIGFLNQKNLISIALSRAKLGLFIIGNMSLLSECSEVWRDIEATLRAQNAIGVLNGPDIRKLMRNSDFEGCLVNLELVAWDNLKAVIEHCLGEVRREDWRVLIGKLLSSFESINVNISLKVHFLHNHIDWFERQIPTESDEHGERFHQIAAPLEHWYSGKKLDSLLTDMC